MANKICQKRKNDNMKIGDKIRLKKLNYETNFEYRNKINEGVGFVPDMTNYKQKFKIIEVLPRKNKMTYKIIYENATKFSFWVEDWQIASNKTKLEI